MLKRLLIGFLLMSLILSVVGCKRTDEEQSAALDQVILTEDGTQENSQQNDISSGNEGSVQEETGKTTVVGEKININALPIGGVASTAEYRYYNHLEEIQEQFILDSVMVFRGIKQELSTPVTIYNEDGECYDRYCETPIQVLEVFYGDIQTGAVITVKEDLAINEDEFGTKHVFHQEYTLPLEKEEYIFILRNTKHAATDGTPVGGIFSGHSFHKISDYEVFKQKVQDGTATDRETFGYEVMDYYLNNPNTALDLEEETIKMADLEGTPTYEEALAALTEEQKALLNKLATRYGTK